MKKSATILGVIFVITVTSMVLADVPRLINYRERLTTGSGDPVSDGSLGVKFYLLNDSTSTDPGALIWSTPDIRNTTTTMYEVDLRELEIKAKNARIEALNAELELQRARETMNKR